MEETTTTDEQPVETGAQAQPETTTDEAAEAHTEETQTDPKVADESVEANAETDENLEWLKNKGVDINNPKAVAEAWRKAEQEFHKTRQEAKASLQQSLPDEEGEIVDPNVLRLSRTVTELQFYSDNPEAKGREDELIAVAKDYPELGQAFNLKALWEIAKGRRVDASVKEAENRGRVAAKTDIARAGSAKTPTGNASTPVETKDKDMFLEGFK